MKVVYCKNCGAKYQINDDEYVSSFECSSCAGELKFLEAYPNKNNSYEFNILFPRKNKNTIVVKCEECGLKYVIKENENILDYECAGCGGSLRYINPEKNRQLDNYIRTRKNELSQLKKVKINVPYEKEIYENSYLVKSIKDRFDKFFSEEQIHKIVKEEQEEKLNRLNQIKKFQKTARTSIPDYALLKFGNEFRFPMSNDYFVLKEFLKNEFFKKMGQFYEAPEESNRLFDKIKNGFSLSGKEKGILSEEVDEEFLSFSFDDLTTSHYIILIGGVMTVLAIIELVFINLALGLMLLLLGVSIVAYGLFRKEEEPETYHKTKIIRKYLLSLPEDYYVFYNVKTPNSPVGINHVIIGSTGIYTIISEKPENNESFKTKNDIIRLIRSEDNERRKFEIQNNKDLKHFRYAMKSNFTRNRGIKQKSLILSEILIDFLNENNIETCFVEPLVGFVNNDIVVINSPLTDEDLFIEELMHTIQTDTVKLDSDMVDKCAVLLSKYSADCSFEV